MPLPTQPRGRDEGNVTPVAEGLEGPDNLITEVPVIDANLIAIEAVEPEQGAGSECENPTEPRARRLPSTAWKTGVSANPGGRPRKDPVVVALLKDNSLAAAQKLVQLMNDPRASPKIQCQAAEVILDRVYGKAVQPIDATVGGNGDPIMVTFMGVLDKWSK